MDKYAEKISYQDGAFPEQHEKRLARLLVDRYAQEIIFLAPNRHQGMKTPDIKMDGLLWEIKSPRGKSSRTIENNFRAALKQSPNVIFDLHRIKVPANKAIAQIKHEFTEITNAKRVIIITKTSIHLDIKR